MTPRNRSALRRTPIRVVHGFAGTWLPWKYDLGVTDEHDSGARRETTLPMVWGRSGVSGLSRHRVGLSRRQRSAPVREIESGGLSGRTELAHDPRETGEFPCGLP